MKVFPVEVIVIAVLDGQTDSDLGFQVQFWAARAWSSVVALLVQRLGGFGGDELTSAGGCQGWCQVHLGAIDDHGKGLAFARRGRYRRGMRRRSQAARIVTTLRQAE